MTHVSSPARPAGLAHRKQLPSKRRGFPTARHLVVLGAAALLLGVAAPRAAEARCIPVAERQDDPPSGFAFDRGTIAAPAGAARVRLAAATGAGARGPALPEGTVELTFLGHSTFLIRTTADATAVTDYNGYIRAPFAPDIVTMNRAHNTHYSEVIEPGVKHALKGWMEKGVIPSHDVTVRDLHVTNLATNIREMAGDSGWAGNSIFIFKSAGLCIGHLGHLHHRLIPSHAARVGMIDVLLAPIDDGYTMPQALLVQVIDDLKPVVVIPMHYGFGGTLESFLALMRSRKFAIRIAGTRSVRFSKPSLPTQPTVVVLEGGG